MTDARAGEVRNDIAGSRFVIDEQGVEDELVYHQRAGRLILIHTEVPDALGGRGIGGQDNTRDDARIGSTYPDQGFCARSEGFEPPNF